MILKEWLMAATPLSGEELDILEVELMAFESLPTGASFTPIEDVERKLAALDRAIESLSESMDDDQLDSLALAMNGKIV